MAATRPTGQEQINFIVYTAAMTLNDLELRQLIKELEHLIYVRENIPF